mgnify:CR=1 FL=1
MIQETIEYRLLLISMLIGFFYLVLRYTVLNTFMWVLIPPILSLLYIFSNNKYRWLSNKMDKIILYYIINGFIITLIGLLVALNKFNISRVFIHLYLPALLYFISRKYTAFSINNILKLTRIVWIISIFFIIDILIEYYFIGTGSYMMIPWVKEAVREYMAGIEDASALERHYMFFNPIMVSSILTSGKGAGILVAVCFAFLFPFALRKRNNYYKKSELFKNSKISILSVLFMLIACSILLPNFSASLSIFLFLLFIGFYTKFFIKILLLIIIFSLLIVLGGLDEILTNLFIVKIIDYNSSFGGTNLEAILSIVPIFQYYIVDNPLAIIFGKIIIEDLYIVSSPAELDLLVYPINYGLSWFIITSSGILIALKYCRQIIKYVPKLNIEHTLALSFLGFILVMLLSNLHYPHFDDHGIVELLFIMLGMLSSMHEMTFNRLQTSLITNQSPIV